MKICKTCNIEKKVSDFYRVKTGSLRPHCKQCDIEKTKRWYRENKEKSSKTSKIYFKNNPDKVRKWARNRRDRLRELSIKYKEGKPCTDCGGIFHYCAMDFDHRDPSTKLGGVFKLRKDLIEKEIEKCDLVCANCHRIRTFRRNNE